MDEHVDAVVARPGHGDLELPGQVHVAVHRLGDRPVRPRDDAEGQGGAAGARRSRPWRRRSTAPSTPTVRGRKRVTRSFSSGRSTAWRSSGQGQPMMLRTTSPHAASVVSRAALMPCTSSRSSPLCTTWNCTPWRVVSRIVPSARSARRSRACHWLGRELAAGHRRPDHARVVERQLLHRPLAPHVAVVLLVDAVELEQHRAAVLLERRRVALQLGRQRPPQVAALALDVLGAHRSPPLGSEPTFLYAFPAAAWPERRTRTGGGRDHWCSPHSVLAEPAQRPARTSSPSPTGRVHGQQPIEAYPRSVSGWTGSSSMAA